MRHVLLGAYVAICLLCLIWPVYAQVGAHIEPFVLGLPFSFAWVVGWCITTFLVMWAYHIADERADAANRTRTPGATGDAPPDVTGDVTGDMTANITDTTGEP